MAHISVTVGNHHGLGNLTNSLSALVVLDSRVDDLEQLIAGLLPGIEAIVLHPHEDGVAQLGALLAARQGLRQLSLVGHGEPGRLWLGSGAINAAALQGVDWRGSFADGAAIAVYGCATGADAAGRDLVAALHNATGAAVAASSRQVGDVARGGSWVLDVRQGDETAPLPFTEATRSAYRGLLNLTFVEAIKNSENLEGATSITVSPDGKFVYATSNDSSAITTFQRDPGTGQLTFVQAIKDGDAGADSLNALTSVIVSPDGKFVYATSTLDSAITTFARDTTTGQLTVANVAKHERGSVDGLHGAISATMSSDGKFVYVASNSTDTIATFARDAMTGGLKLVEVDQDELSGGDGLSGAVSVTVSPDGKSVYAAALFDNAITTFARDAITGELTFVEFFQDNVNGVDGLGQAYAVTVSPDGKFVYAASVKDNAIATFARDAATGKLTFVEVVKDGGNDGAGNTIDGLRSAHSVTVSPDGKFVYAAGRNDNAIAMFARNATTGKLTFVEVVKDGVDGVDGLYGSHSVTTSSDGKFVYATGFSEAAIAVFSVSSTATDSDASDSSGGGASPAPEPLANFAQPGGGGVPDGQIDPVSFAPEGESQRRIFQIFNGGNADLELLDVALPPGFSLVGLSRRTIPGGQAALLEVAFTGDTPGLHTGNVIVKTNVPRQPFYNFPVEALVAATSGTLPTRDSATAQLSQPTLVNGSDTDDEILGGSGSQVLSGLGGNDALNGNQGDDVLDGGDGDDILNGGQGEDVLIGGAGNDILAGDLGSDALIGGDGADTFVLGETKGIDTIYDFTAGSDRIALEPTLTFADLTLTPLDGNLQLFAGAKQLAIVLNTSSLTAADFGTL